MISVSKTNENDVMELHHPITRHVEDLHPFSMRCEVVLGMVMKCPFHALFRHQSSRCDVMPAKVTWRYGQKDYLRPMSQIMSEISHKDVKLPKRTLAVFPPWVHKQIIVTILVCRSFDWSSFWLSSSCLFDSHLCFYCFSLTVSFTARAGRMFKQNGTNWPILCCTCHKTPINQSIKPTNQPYLILYFLRYLHIRIIS